MAEQATPSAPPDLRGLAERLADLANEWEGRSPEDEGAPLLCVDAVGDTLDRCARELRAALAGPEDGARSAWRPIAEAPKDGRWVIGWDESVGGMIQMCWNHDFLWWDDVGGFAVRNPSHWMRPAPPVAAARPSGEQEGQ